MRALLSLFFFGLACSSQPTNTDPVPQLPTLPPITKKADPQTTSTQAASTQSASTTSAPVGQLILSDLMLRVRENSTPLLLPGDEGKLADQKMEQLFLKIRASAPNTEPDDWNTAWIEITESAISGKPDALGRRPWSAACKKCHDTYRDNYKKKYHTRKIPITLDDI